MAVRRPTLDQLRSVAEDLGMHYGRRGAQILRRPDAGELSPPTMRSTPCRTMSRR